MRAPAWNRHKPMVPFDKSGNMLHYPDWQMTGFDFFYPFKGIMEIDGITSGRSAKYLTLKDTETGQTYPMFVSDLVEFIQLDGEVSGGKLTAIWGARKKGANYGIGVYKP